MAILMFVLFVAVIAGAAAWKARNHWAIRKAGRIRSYDPSNVVVTFNGKQLSGHADGTFVEVGRSSYAGEVPLTRAYRIEAASPQPAYDPMPAALMFSLIDHHPSPSYTHDAAPAYNHDTSSHCSSSFDTSPSCDPSPSYDCGSSSFDSGSSSCGDM